MATELIADQVVTAIKVPEGMAINPILDWAPVIGIPVWIYITVILILFFLYVNLKWILQIKRLAPVKGWAESMKKMTQEDVQVWVISRVKRLTIECMTIKDNVLSSHDPLNIGMWYVSSPMGVISVGGMPAVVVSEDFDRNRDFVTEIALCHNLDQFNTNLEWLKEQADKRYKEWLEKIKLTGTEVSQEYIESKKPKIMKPIESFGQYDNYGRACLYNMNPEQLMMPSYSIFDPHKFRKYFPVGNTSMFYGGEMITEARDMNIDRREKGFWEVHAFLIMAGTIGMIALVVAAFFPMGV